VISTKASTLASRLFPDTVVTAETTVFPDVEELHAAELRQVQGAVAQRVLEFAAGRACARAGLAELGLAYVTLLSGNDRLPIWPPGITGSITHTANYCGAAIVPKSFAQSIGLDAEPNKPLDQDLWSYVCSSTELSWLGNQASSEQDSGRLARLIFSIKEAVFKSQYPLTHRFLDFDDVQVRLDLDSFGFSARIASPESQNGVSFSGRYLLTPELILTGVLYPA
jgi:4'-phosphopantetheinyl transferase EntD